MRDLLFRKSFSFWFFIIRSRGSFAGYGSESFHYVLCFHPLNPSGTESPSTLFLFFFFGLSFCSVDQYSVVSLLHASTLSESCGRSFPPLEEALFLPDCSKGERLSTESSRPWKEADGYLCSPPFCVCHVSAKCGHRFLAGAPDFIQVFIEVKIGAEEFYQSKPQLLCQGMRTKEDLLFPPFPPMKFSIAIC